MKKIVIIFLRLLLLLWFVCAAFVAVAPFLFAFSTGNTNPLIVCSLVISALFVSITVCYDNFVEYFEEKLGPLTIRGKHNMWQLTCMPANTLIYVIGGILISLMLQSACNHSNRAGEAAEEIALYKDYYTATETLLDSLGVDGDAPILESDAGADYLQKKYDLDNYINSK